MRTTWELVRRHLVLFLVTESSITMIPPRVPVDGDPQGPIPSPIHSGFSHHVRSQSPDTSSTHSYLSRLYACRISKLEIPVSAIKALKRGMISSSQMSSCASQASICTVAVGGLVWSPRLPQPRLTSERSLQRIGNADKVWKIDGPRDSQIGSLSSFALTGRTRGSSKPLSMISTWIGAS